MPDPRPEHGYTELTPHLAARMGQLWAARQWQPVPANGWRSLLLDALTLPTGPPGLSEATRQRRKLAWLRAMHQRSNLPP